jgi:hypothetical protein
MSYEDGYAAWLTDLPLEHYEELGVVNDYFLDGWLDAKEADPVYQEETMIWGDHDDTEAEAETTMDGPGTQAGVVARRLHDS